MKSVPIYARILSVAVSILTPLILLMIAIRALIFPVYAQFAYRLPGFPDDPFGFTIEDRLKWSAPSIRYLVNSEDISYLADLKFDDGMPIYNQRELVHMEDVKVVVSGMRLALAGSMIFLLVTAIFAHQDNWTSRLRFAIYIGGWGVIGLILAILLFVAINFNSLFTYFHKIFFEDGTWQFYTSDTLIRLFPMRFWQDAFIMVGVISLVMGVLILMTTGKPQKSKH